VLSGLLAARGPEQPARRGPSYILLSLTAKTLLAWLVFANVLRV
jgi:hypothetical protein